MHLYLVVRRGFGEVVEFGSSTVDLLDDLFSGLGPHEGLGFVVPVRDPHVDRFEVAVRRQLEPADPPRSQLPFLPDPRHGLLAYTVTVTHRASRPRCRLAIRDRVQRVVHDRVDRVLLNCGLAAPARRDRPHGVKTTGVG